MSLSKMHCCYIIFSTECKGKHALEPLALGLKKKHFIEKKKTFILVSSLRAPGPFLLLEGHGPLLLEGL